MTQPASDPRGRRGRLSVRHLAAAGAILLSGVCRVVSGAEGAAGTKAVEPAAGSSPAGSADRRLSEPAAATNRAARSVMLAVASIGQRIVAAGERGLVIYSDDCGASWQQATVPVSVTLTAIHFVDASRGWAVGHGGVVLSTGDAGRTWSKQLDGKAIAALALAAAKERSAQAGASAEESKRRLSDAQRLVSDGPDKPLFAVHFWTPKRGIVLGAYGLALMTEDGGERWQWIGDRIPNAKGAHLYGLSVQEDDIVIVGEQGFVVRSKDGGRMFGMVGSPYAGSFFGIVSLGGGSQSDRLVYGLRGRAFRMPSDGAALQPVALGVKASVLSALQQADGGALLFDADGQAMQLEGRGTNVRKVGSSPVGPVVGVAGACGNTITVAGFRGVAVVDAATLVAAKSSEVRQ